MVINNPTLPPRGGFIEVEIDGERRHESIVKDNSLLEDSIIQLLVDQEYKITLIELGV